MKRLLLLFCLTFIPLAASAQDEGRTYVIQKGDTLWGISERFLKDPDYWPSLWSHNPDLLTNPHFIYPGQEVRIYGGRLELVPVRPEPAPAEPAEVAAPKTVEKLETVPEPQEEITIKTPGGASRFVSTEELETAGVLVDTMDNRMLLAAGDLVFAEMKPAANPGERFTIFTTIQEVTHPATGQKVGALIADLGVLEIVERHQEVATGKIVRSDLEISRGARLRPWQPVSRKVALKKAAVAASGTVLTGANGRQSGYVQHDIVHIDLGSGDGLEVGNMLYISRPRTVTRHALAGKENLALPDILLGSGIVVETRPDTASVLVLKIGNNPIEKGDRATTVTE